MRWSLLALALASLLLPACPTHPPAAPAPPVAPPSAPAPAPATRLAFLEPLFRVELEQNGVVVPVRDHEARLEARPFAIVIHARDPKEGILLNVSRSPELFERARGGKDLLASFQPGTGMAEDAVLRHRNLYLAGELAHHYLIHADGFSRYHQVERRGLRYRCLRRVEALELIAERRTLALSEIDRLYLVFFLGSPDGGKERRREAIQIQFPKRR